MNEWLVDTNVLLDVIGGDPLYGERSLKTLTRLGQHGMLTVNPIIYAEVGALLSSLEELDELLPRTLFRRDDLPWEACFLAGQAFRRYRQQGGQRRRVLADFLIGAHAAVAGFGLVSRDQGYRRYFDLQLVDPSRPQ